MLGNLSSLFSKKYSSKASSSRHMNDYKIERLESRLGTMRLKNNDDQEVDFANKISKKLEEVDTCLELKLAHGNFPITPQDHERTNAIHAIGREDSIKSLIQCPRYKHASIKSGEIYKIRSTNKIIEHWVYFACHLLKWEAFDPISKKWMHLPMITANTCFEYSDKESVAVGTDLLVLGKDAFGQAIKKYSLLTNSWSSGKPMNAPRCLFGSASLGSIAIFAGGVNESGKIVDTVESYDSETGAWETLPRLLKPRKMSSGVFMDGKFYVIGGSGGNPFSCGEEYDLNARKWKEIPNMSPGGGGSPPLLAVVDNELYAADCVAMEVKKYDKQMKVWVRIGCLPKKADNMAGWGIAFRGCGDRVIIVGGPRTHGDGYVEIYSWFPSEGPPQWTMIGRKKSDNFVYNCAIMGC